MPLLQLEQDDNWKASEVVFVVASTTIINALVLKVDRIEQSMMRGSVIKRGSLLLLYSYPTACCLSNEA
jgi:hypothetical protein